MKEVARAANLSAAAVSLALRGHPSIPEKTRERVATLAAALGYSKDPLLMALTARRSQRFAATTCRTLAFLTNEPNEDAFRSLPHLEAFFDGFRRKAEEFGYEAELVFAGGDVLEESVVAQLAELDCRAALIGAFNLFEPWPNLDWSRYAVARIESLFTEPTTVSVCNDQVHTVGLAYANLRRLGYERIGLATGRADELYSDDLFLAGRMLEAVKDSRVEEVPPLYFEREESFDQQSSRLAAWVEEYRVDAVVSNWGRMIERAESSGLQVPKDVAFASLCLADTTGRQAGVVQEHAQVGELAADLLVARLRSRRFGPDMEPTITYVKGRWLDGETAPQTQL